MQTNQEPNNEELQALKKKVAELEKQLKYQEMRADAYDTMIDIAEKKFNIPIRKKAGAKQ
jgi:cell division septum initiation protein DivIVA